MKGKQGLRRLIIVLLTIILFCGSFNAFAEEEAADVTSAEQTADESASTAELLTDLCRVTTTITPYSYPSRLVDSNKNTYVHFKSGQSVTISWTESVPVAAILYSFDDEIVPHTVLQYDAEGTLLEESEGESFWNVVIYPLEGTYSVEIKVSESVNLCTLQAYGEGNIPDYQPWEPTLEKADYLLVVMHPDDDALFLGGVVPIYTGQDGYDGVMLYMATRLRVRKDEAMDGAWTMGLRNQPILEYFPDIPDDYKAKFENTFKINDVVLYLVRILRQLQPEVVISHDLEGEYGHWQHKLLAEAILEAVPLAADETYDVTSVEEYGVWEVKKVYLHLYTENQISLPVTEPLSAFDGKTAVEIATEAFACHVSQMPSRHSVTNEGIYSLSDFGLAYTTVGYDTDGVNDMFEHIDLAAIHATPTPEPTVTPESTATPTSLAIVVFDTPTPAAAQTGDASAHPWRWLVIVGIVLGSLCAAFVAFVVIGRAVVRAKRRKKKQLLREQRTEQKPTEEKPDAPDTEE